MTIPATNLYASQRQQIQLQANTDKTIYNINYIKTKNELQITYNRDQLYKLKPIESRQKNEVTNSDDKNNAQNIII